MGIFVRAGGNRQLPANSALGWTVDCRGPHLWCQRVVGWLCARRVASWPAVQLRRSAAE